MLSFLVLLVLPLLSGCSTASAPPSRMPERALLRSTAPSKPAAPNVTMQHDYYALEDTLHVFFKFEDTRQLLNLQRAVSGLEYIVRAGSSERDATLLRDSVRVTAPTGAAASDGAVGVQLKLPAKLVAVPNVLQLRLLQKQRGQERPLRFYMPLKPEMLQKDFMVLQAASGQPLLRQYVTTQEPLVLKQYKEEQPTQVLYYNAEFVPALPPMSTRQEPSPNLLKPTDSTTYTGQDTIRLEKSGLYLLKRGTEKVRGLTAQPNAFPQITKAQEMLEPLIYLTTSEERDYLMKTKDPKATVDEFWLKIAQNSEVARSLIKTFYSRVEEANKLYTSHKPGWATDRGMIYIVYGPPSNISRVGNTETWIYRETDASPYVKFVFNKKENTFTENYYELIRHRDYGESWYSTVAKWRAGIAET